MDWQTWVKGLVSAIIGGGAAAVTVVIVDPLQFNFQTGAAKLLTVIGVNAIISAAMYLKASPLPNGGGTEK